MEKKNKHLAIRKKIKNIISPKKKIRNLATKSNKFLSINLAGGILPQ